MPPDLAEVAGKAANTVFGSPLVEAAHLGDLIGSDGDEVRRIRLILKDDAIEQLDGETLLDAGLAIRRAFRRPASRCGSLSSMSSSVSSTSLALINPEHLFIQADALLLQLGRGSLRQADLRRAVSNADDGLFHAILTAAADEVAGRKMRGEPLWSLAYRSISHQRMKNVCNDSQARPLKPKIRSYELAGGFGSDVAAIVGAVMELQDRRHVADYDSSASLLRLDARAALQTARSAVERLGRLTDNQRKAFLFLILFEPRG